MIIYPNWNYEEDLAQRHQGQIAGIDEAGCGPWAGPLVAAAVVVTPAIRTDSAWAMIRDSKQLTESARECCWAWLSQQSDIHYGIGIVSSAELDALGLGKALVTCYQYALNDLITKGVNPAALLIDGIRKPALDWPMETCVKGDQKSFSIAAASIIAKVTRDRAMQTLHEQYPVYGWQQNKGYGTRAHHTAIATHGLSPQHRYSFKPIQQLHRQSSLSG